MRHQDFLKGVELYVKANPEVAAHIASHVERGISSALQETRERASDMEAALSVAIAKRYKKRDELILQKLEKWKDKSSLNWTNTINDIKCS